MFILDMSFPSYHPMSNSFDNKCSLTWITWYVYHPSKYKEQRETPYFEHRPFAIKFSITYGVKQPLETTGMALSRSHSSDRGFFFDWNSATVTTEVFFLFQNNQLLIMICKASFVLHINGNLMQMRSDRYQWYLYSCLKVTRALYSILKCVIGSYTPQVITAIFTRAAFF